ncbi:MAG: Asp-tRNA(Asn)/Glu-tRNA(Gln) amidotransferase subunit GatC [Firmicutes bacterium]|nr:Asp-tRNA(Asn)/Glu-tRNA(Gln) amidotransferase subunit GatC [Bacillota bacterium]
MTDEKTIAYLEELSKFRLNENEKEKFKDELGRIIEYIGKLNKLDTKGIEPLSHPFIYTSSLREDTIQSSSEREDILKNAHDNKDGCFKVLRTVE